MVWILLAAAILCEVTATLSLRLVDGFTRVGPTLVVVAGYVASFYLLAQVIRHGLPLAVVYTIWAGVGVLVIALFSAAFLGEGLTRLQIAGAALVLIGAAIVKLAT
ncbi:DMT family transporter [Nocardia sp. CA-107356]|uniref:DMT family transporter n=1 Tax=Nocardia sp. CA-107356 TaxID=3239972 RepID=UPI003D89B43B